jgi:NAD(P)-dependent dehydrogenase (short-subunit alcohol dehydrogenase family)
MTTPWDFSDRTVFVAGGTSGINRGIAVGFAQAGAAVGVLSRSEDKVASTVAELKGLGVQAVGFAADVRDGAAVNEALAGAAAALGPFDVLVSGAAGNFPAPALGMSEKGFRSVVDIDLVGTFNVTRGAFDHLKKPGGSIINISAPQAYAPAKLQLHVCAAKAGVDMVTRVLAMEWGGFGIRVNSIAPGPIEGTEGMKRLAPGPLGQMVADSVPLKRMGTVQDIAHAALFLSSPLASYISGVVLPVDGAWSLAGFGAATEELVKMVDAQQGG